MPATRIAVQLSPRANRDEIAGFEGETLRVRVAAAPVDGAANTALLRLLAKRLRVAKGAVRLVRGQRSRRKTVEVEGLSAAELRRRLQPPAATDG